MSPLGLAFRGDGQLEEQTADLIDSFDWDLWHSGSVVMRSGSRLELYRLADFFAGMGPVEETSIEEGFSGRWEELEGGDLRLALKKAVGVRRLLPSFSCRREIRTQEIENGEGKVVVRLRATSIFIGQQRAVEVLSLFPLVGYEPEAEKLVSTLGLSLLEPGDLAKGLAESGVVVRQRGASQYELHDSMLVGEAVQRIALSLLCGVRENIDGVVRDLDIEFLHDFRVSLRKLRSLMTALKGAFRPEDGDPLRELLAKLARRTNRLRDLDVQLLAREEYEGMLPVDMRDGLGEMFEDFSRFRAEEQGSVAAWLESEDFKNDLLTIEDFFQRGLRGRMTDLSFGLISRVAADRAWKRYRKLLKSAGQMTETSPDEAVHNVRIEAKKLRYVTEFFGGVLDSGRLERMMKSLKRLQNALGVFNDRSVHRVHLWEYWKTKEKLQHRSTALAIGGLLATLQNRQDSERERILDSLAKLTAEKSVARVREVLQDQGPTE